MRTLIVIPILVVHLSACVYLAPFNQADAEAHASKWAETHCSAAAVACDRDGNCAALCWSPPVPRAVSLVCDRDGCESTAIAVPTLPSEPEPTRTLGKEI